MFILKHVLISFNFLEGVVVEPHTTMFQVYFSPQRSFLVRFEDHMRCWGSFHPLPISAYIFLPFKIKHKLHAVNFHLCIFIDCNLLYDYVYKQNIFNENDKCVLHFSFQDKYVQLNRFLKQMLLRLNIFPLF